MSRLHADQLGIPTGGLPRLFGGPSAYTPVVTWAGNTITTQSGFYLERPGLLQVWVSFVESAGTATAAVTITIPTGYTAVTMAGSLSVVVGTLARITNIGQINQVIVAAGATTQVATTASAVGAVDTWSAFMQIPTTS